MMRPALLLALLACLVGSGQANGSSPSLATGVPFGGIMMAFDTSSDPGLDSGSSAALSVRTQGSPVLSSGGVQGTALRLDGVDDAVMLDTGFTPISCDGIPNCEDRGDTFTLAFHVKLEPSQGAPGSKFLVCSRGQDDDSDTGIGATYPFVINSRQSNNPRGSHVNFGTWSGDVNHVNLEACAGGPSAQYDWAPGTAWSHITIVSTPTTAKFFVDGVEKSPTGTTTCAGFKLGAHPMVGVSSIWSDAGGPLRLFDANGAWLPGGPRTRINANIDNLYFVTEALSASAIGSLYTFSAANSLLMPAAPVPTPSPTTAPTAPTTAPTETPPSLATGVPFGGIMMAFDTSSDPGLDSGSSAALSVRTQGSPVLSSGGVQGTALRLDGVDDAVMLDTGFTPISCDGIPNCEDRGDTFTLAFHVKLEPSQGAPGSKFLVCSRGQDDDSDTGIGATYPFVINSRQSNNPRGSHVNFGTWSGDVNHVNLEACAGGPSAQYDWAPGTAWSHITIVSTPTTAKFFVDGVEKSPTGTTTCAGFKLGAHPMVGVSSIWSDAGGPLRLFDANGAWLPGGPRTRINANIDNLYFVTEALSASAVGSLYTFSAANSLLVTPAPTVSPVTFTGYLADTRCLGVVNGMDGVNASAEAPKHTVGCMLAPPCLASGYNLLEQVGNEYVVQYVAIH